MIYLKHRAAKQSGALSISIALKNRDNEYKPLEVFERDNFGPRGVLAWFPLVADSGGRKIMYSGGRKIMD
jgi:hypothetical protein